MVSAIFITNKIVATGVPSLLYNKNLLASEILYIFMDREIYINIYTYVCINACKANKSAYKKLKRFSKLN